MEEQERGRRNRKMETSKNILEKNIFLYILHYNIMLERFTEELNNFAEELIEQYKSNLESNGHDASGNLANSVTFEVHVNDYDFGIELNLSDYWIYVEEGRGPGKFPPPDAILNWINVKNIMPHEINGKLPSEQSLAFLIGRKIAEEGTRGTHDMEDAKRDVISKYETILSEALAEDYNEEAMEMISESLFFNI